MPTQAGFDAAVANIIAQNRSSRSGLSSVVASQPTNPVLFGIDEVNSVSQILSIVRTIYFHTEEILPEFKTSIELFCREPGEDQFRYDVAIALSEIAGFKLRDGGETNMWDIRSAGLSELALFLKSQDPDRKSVVDDRSVRIFLESLKNAEIDDDEIISPTLEGLIAAINNHEDTFKPFGRDAVAIVTDRFNENLNNSYMGERYKINVLGPDVLDAINNSSSLQHHIAANTDAEQIIKDRKAGKTGAQIRAAKNIP